MSSRDHRVNRYCETLKIDPPNLGQVRALRSVATFDRLLIALLERGEPMTLTAVAERFDSAGVAPAAFALEALKKCRPGRPPLYRDGDLYGVDCHHPELDLRLFILGLRAARAPRVQLVKLTAPHPPSPEEPLTSAELEEAWGGRDLYSLPRYVLVLAVLEALGRPASAEEVAQFVNSRAGREVIRTDPAVWKRPGSPVALLADGRWSIGSDPDALRSARHRIRERIEDERRRRTSSTDAAVIRALGLAADRRREAHAAELSLLRRALLVGFPIARPQVLLVADLSARSIATFTGAEVDSANELIANFDLLGGIEIRTILKGIGVDHERFRVSELSPPQRTITIAEGGRPTKVTLDLLIAHSCLVERRMSDTKSKLAQVRAGSLAALQRRLERDLDLLVAYYEYSRLHHCFTLRQRGWEAKIPVPWIDRDETSLWRLLRSAAEAQLPLEAVVGAAPDWRDPWRGAESLRVAPVPESYDCWLIDQYGREVDQISVQRARLIDNPEA
ncbi:MAG: hypothetical protein IT349_21375 [Candidatus Eisenbacteria bacterium]|nr:hypothetical protein [Candidatus Eisenbacteria bacterium]